MKNTQLKPKRLWLRKHSRPKWDSGECKPASVPVIKTTRYPAASFICARPQLSTLPLLFPAVAFFMSAQTPTPFTTRSVEALTSGPPSPEERAGLFDHADSSIVPPQREEQKRIALESSRGAFTSFSELYPPGLWRGCGVSVKPLASISL